ncbi:MAG TPA: TonB-dependent receptor [Hansschlegelia sp.]
MTASRAAGRLRLGLVGTLALAGGDAAYAQQPTLLPEIEVTSPSPIRAQREAGSETAFQYGVLPVVSGTFAPVTVVTQGEIVRDLPRTLGDALFDKPGVTGSSYAPGAASRPIIRGLEGARIRIQENGIGVHDVSPLGEDHAVPINPIVADRIEVVRGPATLRYGSQAIGGVVSVDNDRIPQFAPPGGVSGEVLGGLSSVDRGRDAAASINAGQGPFVFHADGFWTKSGNYDTPDGRQANSQTRSAGGSVGGSWIFDNGYFGLSYSHFDALYHIPGGEAAESNTRLDPKQDKLQAQGEWRFDGGPFEAARFWLGGSSYKHNEIGVGEDGVDGVQATFKNREVEGRVEIQHREIDLPFGALTGAFGVQGDYAELRTGGEAGELIPPADTGSAAAYVFEQVDFGGGFRAQGAARIEHASIDGTATTFPSDYLPGGDLPQSKRNRHFTPMSVSGGLLQDLPHGFVASITGSYVERAPQALELFSRGPHDAPGTFEIGDPNLKLEKAKSIEIGLRRAEGPLRVDASAYYTRYSGFIYRRLTGARCDDDFDSCGTGDELAQVVYSQQNAKFYGADLAVQMDAITLGRNVFGVDGQYDFVRAKFSDGTDVPRIPPHRLGGGVFWRSEDGFYGRVGLLHAFAHDETAPFETRTPGYDNLKAELSYTRTFDREATRLKSMTVGLVGENLLDDRIRNSASFKKDEILLPGANVRAFVRASF